MKLSESLSRLWRAPDAAALVVIATSLLVRLAIAATFGFTVDESYTLANARQLSLSYFDHPPAQSWIAWVFMRLLGDGHALRLPFVFIFAGSSWLLYRLTGRLFGASAGVWAVLGLNLSAFFLISPGTWIVPDGPLIFFQLAAALTLVRGFFPDSAPPSPWATWILTGAFIGLAALSKYHAVLFGLGVLLYVASMPDVRRVLLHPAPWLGALIALLVFSPVLVWNAEHGWASFQFQAARAAAGGGLHPGNVVVMMLAQTVWILPWVFVPLAVAAWQAVKVGRAEPRQWFCVCLGAPTILIFVLTPLWGDRGLPHWTMPGWLMLYPVLGNFLEREGRDHIWPLRWATLSAAALAGLAVVIVGQASTGYGKMLFPGLFARGDPTLEALEWGPLDDELKARGYLDDQHLFIVAPDWIAAGRIDVALGGKVPVTVFPANAPKDFEFLTDRAAFLGRDALVIGHNFPAHFAAGLRQFFDSVEDAPPYWLGRSGMQEIELKMMFARKLLRPFPKYYEPSE